MRNCIPIFLNCALALAAALGCAIGHAQTGGLQFHHLDNTHGLPQNTVNAILEDRYGFLWFGTQDGLCRYDGHDFTIYRNDGSANSLSNNYVWCLAEADDGALWIGTFGGGSDRFDPATGVYTHHRHDPRDPASLSSDRVLGLLEHPAGVLWVRTSKGLDRLDMGTDAVTRYLSGSVSEGDLIGAIAPDDAEHLLVQGAGGLLRFAISTGHMEVVKPSTAVVQGHGITAVSRTPEGYNILENRKFYRMDPHSGAEVLITDAETLVDADPRIGFQCFLIKGDHLFIGTTHGLVHQDLRTGHARIYRHQADVPNSLADDHVLSLHAGSGGEIWVGTRNGLDRIERLDPSVHALTHNPGDPKSLIHESVTALLEDDRGRIWIGSPAGLTIWDRSDGSFIHLRNDPGDKRSLAADYILSLAITDEGRILVGTLGGGLHEVIEENGMIRFTRHMAQGMDDPRRANIVHHILPTAHGTTWLASGGAGLCQLDQTGRLTCQGPTGDNNGPAHPYLFRLLEDDAGYIWMGTAGGGLLLREPGGHFGVLRHKPEDMGSINADVVLCAYQDPRGHLWVGTVNGLCRSRHPLNDTLRRAIMDDRIPEGLFQRSNRAEGLPNEVIYGIQPDGSGHLWLSTNAGLVQWDMERNTVLRVLDHSDGLPGDEFNQNAFMLSKDGTLFFGGAKGLCWFKPNELRTNQRPPPVRFTGVELFNQQIGLRSGAKGDEFVLDRAPHLLEQLDLAWHHRVVSFTFAALNFIAPERNRYRYQLEGFDDRWTEPGPQNKVTFTNLAPGEYVLRVQATNNDGIWNEEGASLRIKVSAPPWLRWYAFVAYALVIGAIVHLAFRYRLQKVRREVETKARIEEARIEDRERFRRKSAADFHDEAGARITRINLYTGLVRQRAGSDPVMTDHLHKIENANRELSAGIRDLIWSMDPSRDTLSDTLERLATFGRALFDATSTAFKVMPTPQHHGGLRLGMEVRRSITLIMKEAMNNCAKYAHAHRCTLKALVDDDRLVIELLDDGLGFDPHATRSPDHNGLRNMQQRAAELGATLDLRSAEGKGSSITLNIPLHVLGTSTAPTELP